MAGVSGRSGGPRIGAGRPRKEATTPTQPSGQRLPITPLQYLADVLSDPAVSAARKDRVAIALLGVLARQGGLGKRAMAELAARNTGSDSTSGWWDPQFGNLLAFNGGQDQEAAQRAREHAAKWDKLINRRAAPQPSPDDE